MLVQRHRIKPEKLLVVVVGLLLTLAQACPSSALAWSIHTVDSAAGRGGYTSIALDSNGMPHISYYDATSGNLKYAKGSCMSAMTISCTWNIETVDADGDVGDYNSIALDAFDNPAISYYDRTSMDLKYAKKSPTGRWSIERVDSEGRVGEYTSIALDSSGLPHISYHGNRSLKYARKSCQFDECWWTRGTVDDGGNFEMMSGSILRLR
jgi:hypothetical protein